MLTLNKNETKNHKDKEGETGETNANTNEDTVVRKSICPLPDYCRHG